MAVMGGETLRNALAGRILSATSIPFAARADAIGRSREQRFINETLPVEAIGPLLLRGWAI